MEHLKKAFSLAKYELTASPLHVLLLFAIGLPGTFLFMFVGISPMLAEYLTNNFVGFDIWFLIIFLLVPAWLRPKSLQIQNINPGGDLWAAPALILQLQLPIRLKTLTMSRMVLYFFFSFPLQCLMLLSMYLVTPSIQSALSFPDYAIFSFIWLMAGIYLGYIMPASDVGDPINVKTVSTAFILLLISSIGLLTLFHITLGMGLVQATIFLAINYPILSMIGSIFLAVSGLYYWQWFMIRRIKQTDYL